MDQINTATLRALVKAERTRRERNKKEMSEVKSVIVEFIRMLEKDQKIPVQSDFEELSLPDLARLAVQMASQAIRDLSRALSEEGRTQMVNELARLRQEVTALQTELAAVPRPLAPAAYTPPTGQNSAEPTLTAAPQPAPPPPPPPEPLPEGSLEDRVLRLAGESTSLILSDLMRTCIEKTGHPEAEIKKAIDALAADRRLVVIVPSYAPKTGSISIPAAFSLTARGASTLNMRSNGTSPAVSTADCLVNSGKLLWLEDVPLLAFFAQVLAPQYGYQLIRYLPENAVSTQNEPGSHLFVTHALLSSPTGDQVQILFVGDRYTKGGIDDHYEDFMQATNGQMHFVCLYAKTARQITSDLSYRGVRQSTSIAPSPRVTNIDDLIRVQQGAAALDDKGIWFTALSRKGQ